MIDKLPGEIIMMISDLGNTVNLFFTNTHMYSYYHLAKKKIKNELSYNLSKTVTLPTLRKKIYQYSHVFNDYVEDNYVDLEQFDEYPVNNLSHISISILHKIFDECLRKKDYSHLDVLLRITNEIEDKSKKSSGSDNMKTILGIISFYMNEESPLDAIISNYKWRHGYNAEYNLMAYKRYEFLGFDPKKVVYDKWGLGYIYGVVEGFIRKSSTMI